jgi:hypothetical protein
MQRLLVSVVIATALLGTPARGAPPVSFQASPNPAAINQSVRFTVSVSATGRALEQIWISASGPSKPSLGDLPPGSWTYECCPAEVGSGPAWHYRSSGSASPGTHSFQAVARRSGRYPGTAAFGFDRASLVLRIL